MLLEQEERLEPGRGRHGVGTVDRRARAAAGGRWGCGRLVGGRSPAGAVAVGVGGRGRRSCARGASASACGGVRAVGWRARRRPAPPWPPSSLICLPGRLHTALLPRSGSGTSSAARRARPVMNVRQIGAATSPPKPAESCVGGAVAEPHRRRELRRAADEPRVALVVGGAGLAERLVTRHLGVPGAGAAGDHATEHQLLALGDVRVEHPDHRGRHGSTRRCTRPAPFGRRSPSARSTAPGARRRWRWWPSPWPSRAAWPRCHRSRA